MNINLRQSILLATILAIGHSNLVIADLIPDLKSKIKIDNFHIGDLTLPPISPKLNTVNVQKWGKNTFSCGSSAKPCATINYGIFRVASTGAPYSEESVNRVFVGPGVYKENVIINKTGIKVVSSFGADVTIVIANNTTNDTLQITADGVYFGKVNKGFTLTGSVNGSGLFSSGSDGIVEGNKALNNGVVGFQFGEQSLGANISDTRVSHNVAQANGNSGFYFYDFDFGTIEHNHAKDNTIGTSAPLGPGFGSNGSGFWIDSQSNDDILRNNVATGNEGSGIFYRRFGVVRHQTRYNKASNNSFHGFMLMGDDLKISDNISVNNQLDGFHFMGYDYVEEFSYNTSVGNTGAGVVFGSAFSPGAAIVDTIHHNNYINNDSILVAGHSNCGITNNLANGAISSENDFWGNFNVPGPGADPADDLCGMTTNVNTPASKMNYRYILVPYVPIDLKLKTIP